MTPQRASPLLGPLTFERRRTRHAYGMAHHNARLDDDTVRAMRLAYALTKPRLTYTQLGERFHCSPWTARDIVKKKTRTSA